MYKLIKINMKWNMREKKSTTSIKYEHILIWMNIKTMTLNNMFKNKILQMFMKHLHFSSGKESFFCLVFKFNMIFGTFTVCKHYISQKLKSFKLPICKKDLEVATKGGSVITFSWTTPNILGKPHRMPARLLIWHKLKLHVFSGRLSSLMANRLYWACQ